MAVLLIASSASSGDATWADSISLNLDAGAQQDAFGRLRVSQPYELFSKACEYDNEPLFYENVLTGSASAPYSSANTSTTLTVAAPGDVAIRQTRWYIRYRPAKSQQVFITGNFNGAQDGVTKRMGLFDDNTQPASTGDGVFFEVDGTGIYAVLRSSATGVSTDTRYPQSSWNGDKLNGTGPSGVTLDLTKQQVALFTFGWLGSAIIQFGFVISGQIVWVHTLSPSNTQTTVYMARPSLPLRWEARTTGTAGTLAATCGSVQSEGGFNTSGVQRSISLAGTGKTTTATNLVPLITIRLKDAYRRSTFEPIDFTVLTVGTSAESYEVRLLQNATLTGATFAAGSASETMEYDTAATAVTGGQLITADYGFGGGRAGGGPSKSVVTADVPLSSNYAGAKDTLTLAVRPLGTGSTTFFASLIWSEFY